mmetsp:Transcript_17276/g.29777  ORF Transcript_17276/g.29777 Transcript_17276/m.29777 type:complete len:139 (-) Transcript_17276:184-600(-)|eukprot:CAMPEP_0183770148 /NCGR_PEP_ID=MMETSP0739-20130205/26406_1 /TAXON_ID=385413 /ORGANISM="Thalassiosira miniscula, Strain CCMP1093" /LENGTH=138 /DNA_ID=CAMNT_0026010021 /DNA_START=19 /DNA_END=435 /DNA_ORIENTATION=-
MTFDKTMGNASCESLVTRKSRGLDQNIQHNPRCAKAHAKQASGTPSKRRGRSCMKSKSSDRHKRHRSASLSPSLRRRSNHRDHESRWRKRSKSQPPQKGQDDVQSLENINVNEGKEDVWTEIPCLVLTGAGLSFPTHV